MSGKNNKRTNWGFKRTQSERVEQEEHRNTRTGVAREQEKEEQRTRVRTMTKRKERGSQWHTLRGPLQLTN